jgi:2-(1,2-epoxy-1,2-dihydrophenyl)acetyl-CoA isomerase
MLSIEGPRDGVLHLRLNRPDRLNALTLALAGELLAAVRQARDDNAVRVLLLSGEGRAFCAGKDRDDPPTPDFVAALQALAAALMDSPKPVVAQVQGWAVGAGLELLLNCDIVLAARSAQFKLPEVNAGLFGTGGVLALLPRKIGLAKAKGVLMLGETFTAEQAERWGLIWAVTDDELLPAKALAVATQLAMSPAAVLAELKMLLHQESFGALAAVLAREAQAHARLDQSSA